MLRNLELNNIRRETERLADRIGKHTAKKTVLFQAINAEGDVSGAYHLDGSEHRGEAEREDYIVLRAPEKAIIPLLQGNRHTVLHGGRAGGKSWTIAKFLVAMAYTHSLKILCVRESQINIKDSIHDLLKDRIEEVPEFLEFFEILEYEIRGLNDSIFTFKGMRKQSAHSIKSYEGYDMCFVEEASALSRRSVDFLIPTIRKPGSRLVWSLNPEEEDQPVYVDFLTTEREDTTKNEILIYDNYFASEESKADCELDKKTNPAKYRHVWLGGLKEKGEGQIFPNYFIVEDVPLDALPFRTAKHRKSYGNLVTSKFEREHGQGSVFCGLDWGHGSEQHPTHVVFGWLSKEQNKILILDEYRGVKKTLDDLAIEIPAKIPLLEQKYIPIQCDNSRPESVAHLRARGLNCHAAPKPKGSVKDGITILQSTKIEICQRCTETIKDFSLYSWKLDANDQPSGEPEDKHNHAPDALRYGVWKYIQHGFKEYMVLRNPYI